MQFSSEAFNDVKAMILNKQSNFVIPRGQTHLKMKEFEGIWMGIEFWEHFGVNLVIKHIFLVLLNFLFK